MTDDGKPIVRGLLSLTNRGPVAGIAGRNGVMVAGIISMPEAMAAIFSSKVWDQRLVTGNSLMDETLMLGIERDAMPMVTEDGEPMTWLRHARIDQFMTHPGIWRV